MLYFLFFICCIFLVAIIISTNTIIIKDRNLKFVWALSLPGKVAPTTSAEFIKNTIYNILREIYKV